MATLSQTDLQLAANTIRGLSMDGVQKANSGHPGMPMGMADIAAVLWLKYLKHCPNDPTWQDRDRFMLSNGHGSMLQYSLLHLAGYDLPLSELVAFRQWDSKTPGHPEHGHTAGVETTTGPLGQGCANAVGMAIAEQMLAARFNTESQKPVDHFTYVFAGDGCLMEGISHEALSLAGHLKLNKLVLFYDDNQITIEGKTDLAYSDDVKKRFQSYHWNVIDIDGHNFDQIDRAIRKAQKSADKPTIIICHTHIGMGSPNKQGKASAHGEPLGADEIRATKKALGMPEDKDFYIPDQVLHLFEERRKKMTRVKNKWQKDFALYCGGNPEKAELWKNSQADALPENLESFLPTFDPAKGMATRIAGNQVLQGMAKGMPWLVGGSADLAPSTKTLINGSESISAGKFGGRNFHFGVREHGMAGILNGMALHGGFRVYGSTFFIFSDYCRPSIRLSALMNLPVIYIFTHDSFCVGEDGPTHEPIEHLAAMRCIPNCTVLRPADPSETGAAWIAALKHKTGPSLLLLTRQDLPVLDRSVYPAANNVEKGAYTLWQSGTGTPDLILMGTGSEVSLVLAAAKEVAGQFNVRVVSMPSWEFFEKQTAEYRESVLPAACTRRIGVEAGVEQGWQRYLGQQGRFIGMNRFGASAPFKTLQEKFGFTVANVVRVIRELK
jgi:transketolase